MENQKIEVEIWVKDIPDDSVGAAADWHDRRAVLAGDLEEVSEDVVLNVLTSVRRNRREVRVLLLDGGAAVAVCGVSHVRT